MFFLSLIFTRVHSGGRGQRNPQWRNASCNTTKSHVYFSRIGTLFGGQFSSTLLGVGVTLSVCHFGVPRGAATVWFGDEPVFGVSANGGKW